MTMFTRIATATASAALLFGAAACGDLPTENAGSDVSRSATPTATRTAISTATAPGAALKALRRLPVKGRAPMTGYDRDRFGPDWMDADQNGCDTRNDMLKRDLRNDVFGDSKNCKVDAGDLRDKYTRKSIRFVYGDGNLVDIDHVVALGNAWVTGGFKKNIRVRAALANDPLNLLAVDASANRQKSDSDAASWLPPNKRYRCGYVARQITVKQKYGLWVTKPEKAAMRRVLNTCPKQRLTKDVWNAPKRVPQNLTDPGANEPATTSPSPSPDGGSGGDVYYENCDAVRAAGAAPIQKGDPGYRSGLDRDGDGTGCE